MRTVPLMVSILLLVLVVILWATTTTEAFNSGESLSYKVKQAAAEGFNSGESLTYKLKQAAEGFETIQDKVVDRASPLASTQNPLTNPVAPIGISETAGAALRDLMQTALNIPKQIVSPDGRITEATPLNPLSPRIDNENSFLGLVKFCKDKGVGDKPFTDPGFAANCGVCITSGKLITGEVFNKPTGVLVYAKDKQAALTAKDKNGYTFPRAFPSLNAATCMGASITPDSQPVLALTQKDYDAFRKRQGCRATHKYGQECAQCISNKEFSWVPSNAETQPINLWLWGQGAVTVRIAGQQIGQTQQLQEVRPTVIQIGEAKEGAHIQIELVKGTGIISPFLYAALQSTNPNAKPYRLPIERFIEKDGVTGSFPRRSTAKRFNDVQLSLAKLVTRANGDRMLLEGTLPLTFIDSDQLAAYDCPASPFVSKQEHAELLVDDPCLNPRGQGPNNYSEDCIRTRILDSGCSTEGSWYRSGLPGNVLGMTLPNIMSWLSGQKAFAETNPQISMFCRGIDISTPCDSYLTNGAVPNKQCLKYLYGNESEKNKRVGRAYSNAAAQFNSLNKNVIQFCQPDGALSPDKPEGEAELIKAAQGYKGYRGIDAVKNYLSDVFMKATGSLDINVPDAQGGRKTSWMKCFGMTLADPQLERVKRNAAGDVMDKKQESWDTTLPLSPRIINNQIIARNVWNSGNYILQFDITPRGLRGSWGSNIHFTRDGNNCCAPGQRMPAIWFFPGNLRLHIRMGDSQDGNWGIDTDAIPMNQRTSFRMECNGPAVTITINSRVITARQPNVRPSGNCMVYCADPWHEPANAVIENLRFRNL